MPLRTDPPQDRLVREAPPGSMTLLLFLLWLVVFLFYSYTAFTVPARSSFLSPDENNTFCVAKQIREKGSVFIDSPLNERFGLKIFQGRLYVEARENRYTAFNSLGLSLLVATGMFLRLPFFVVPFLASLGVLGIYLAVKELAGSRAGLLAGILYGLLPTNIFFSNQILDATPSSSLFLLALGAILTAMRKRSRPWALVSGASLGLSFLVRQATAIYILLFLLFILYCRKRTARKLWLPFFVSSASIAASTMVMNKLVYGSFFHSGQLASTGESISKTLLPGFDLKDAMHSINTYIIGYLPLLSLLAVIGFILAMRGKTASKWRSLHVMLAAVALAAILSFGSRSGTWSFEQFSINASMARYFLPVYSFLAIYASLALDAAVRRGKSSIASLLVVATLCSCAVFAYGSLELTNVQRLKTRSIIYDQAKEQLLKSDEPTLVLTKRMDKDLYNDVEVGLCFTENDLRSNPDLSTFPIIDPEKDLLPVIDQLLEEGWRVLVASDAAELIDALKAKGYTLNQLMEYGSLSRIGKGGGL
jgi:hypothetical protein